MGKEKKEHNFFIKIILLIVSGTMILVLMIFCSQIFFLLEKIFSPGAYIELQVNNTNKINKIEAHSIEFSADAYSFFLSSKETLFIETSNVIIYSGLENKSKVLDDDIIVRIEPFLGSATVDIFAVEQWDKIEDPVMYKEYNDDLDLYTKFGGSVGKITLDDDSTEYYKRAGSIYASTDNVNLDDEIINRETSLMDLDIQNFRVNPIHEVELREAKEWIFVARGSHISFMTPDGSILSENEMNLDKGIKGIWLDFRVECPEDRNKINLWSISEMVKDGNTTSIQENSDEIMPGKGVTYFSTTNLATPIYGECIGIKSIYGKFFGNLNFEYSAEHIEREVNDQELYIGMADEKTDIHFYYNQPEFSFNYKGNAKETKLSGQDWFPNLLSWLSQNINKNILTMLIMWGSGTIVLYKIING